MLGLKQIMLLIVFMFGFSGVLSAESKRSADARCSKIFMKKVSDIQESVAKQVPSLEEATRDLEVVTQKILNDMSSIVDFVSAGGLKTLSREEQERVYLMFEFLKSQIDIVPWKNLIPEGQSLSYDSAKERLLKLFRVGLVEDLSKEIVYEWREIQKIVPKQPAFVFNIWKNLIDKYKEIYYPRRIKDKIGFLQNALPIIDLMTHNIEETDTNFTYIAYTLYKRSPTLGKILPNFQKDFNQSGYYTTSSLIRFELIERIYTKIQQTINALSKQDFIEFLSKAIKSPMLVKFATKDTEVSSQRTYILRFVDSFPFYLDMYSDEINDIFNGVDIKDLNAILLRLKQQNVYSWMSPMPDFEDSLLSEDLVDLITAIHYWYELNQDDSNGSIAKIIFRNEELQELSIHTIALEYFNLDELNKLYFIWFLAGQKHYLDDFSFITYMFGNYILQTSQSKYDRELVEKFIMNDQDLVEAKNSFVIEQFKTLYDFMSEKE